MGFRQSLTFVRAIRFIFFEKVLRRKPLLIFLDRSLIKNTKLVLGELKKKYHVNLSVDFERDGIHIKYAAYSCILFISNGDESSNHSKFVRSNLCPNIPRVLVLISSRESALNCQDSLYFDAIIHTGKLDHIRKYHPRFINVDKLEFTSICEEVDKLIYWKYGNQRIYPHHDVSVGRDSFHNGNFLIRGGQKIEVGSYCAIGKNVSIITANHDYNYPAIQSTFYEKSFHQKHPGDLLPLPNKEKTKGGVKIGSDVWIADNVVILSGVEIGNGACIGNGSVVTKNVPPYSIYAGVPAKEIKKRFSPEVIKFLNSIAWWEWDNDKIADNNFFFNTNLNSLSEDDLTKLIK